MRKVGIIALMITLALTQFACNKYPDGPIISLRSKKNRVGHKIGKKWRSETYILQMGQEGYALNIPGKTGFFDTGNWNFSDSKEYIIFSSSHFEDYEARILKLKHKELHLEGKLPFDATSEIHKFELENTVEKVK